MGRKGRAPHLRPKSLYVCLHFHWADRRPEKLADKGNRRKQGEGKRKGKRYGENISDRLNPSAIDGCGEGAW